MNPEGDHYFPAFPFTSYTGMKCEDLVAIKAYLLSIAPVRKKNREHDLSMPEVIEDCTSQLTDDGRRAIATYLKTVKPPRRQ